MSNPTELAIGPDYDMAIVATSTTASSMTLDPKKQYYVQHNGINESGTERTDIIILAKDGETPALTSGSGKFLLKNGGVVLLPPDITTLGFKANGNDPSFSIEPLTYTKGRY